MRFDKLIWAFLIFTLFWSGGLLVWQSMLAPDRYDIDSDFTNYTNLSIFNKTNELYVLSQEMHNKTLEADIKEGEEPWQSFVTSSYSAIRLVPTSYSLLGSIFDELAALLGIHALFKVFLMAGFAASITFAAIYLVFRFKP